MYNEAIARAVLADRARERDSSLHANLMLGREHRRGTEPVVTDTLCVDGTALGIRPIELTDVDRLARMARRLSPKSIYFRFARRSGACRGRRCCGWRTSTIAAATRSSRCMTTRSWPLRDTTSSRTRTRCRCETRRSPSRSQTHGSGGASGVSFANRLCALARERGYDAIRATILPENRPALDLMRKLVPDASVRLADGTYEARFPLRPDPDASHFAPA